MVEPDLNRLFQWGFAVTAATIIKFRLHGLYVEQNQPTQNVIRNYPGPVFFYSTHASFWEPVVAAYLTVFHFKKQCIAPMDEKEFNKHPALRKTGIFGINPGEGELVDKLLEKIWAAKPSQSIWLTPQGKFSPNHEPQPKFKPGLSRWSLARECLRLPVAIDYRQGEAQGIYVRYGDPLPVHHSRAAGNPEIAADQELLHQALQENVNVLLSHRDKKKFRKVL